MFFNSIFFACRLLTFEITFISLLCLATQDTFCQFKACAGRRTYNEIEIVFVSLHDKLKYFVNKYMNEFHNSVIYLFTKYFNQIIILCFIYECYFIPVVSATLQSPCVVNFLFTFLCLLLRATYAAFLRASSSKQWRL